MTKYYVAEFDLYKVYVAASPIVLLIAHAEAPDIVCDLSIE